MTASSMSSATVLTSWKEIARYMGKGVRTVQRWEVDFGLPVRRPMGANKKAILARPADLDAWVAMRCSMRVTVEGANHGGARSSLCAGVATARLLRQSQKELRHALISQIAALKGQLMSMCEQECGMQPEFGRGGPRRVEPILFRAAEDAPSVGAAAAGNLHEMPLAESASALRFPKAIGA